MRCLKPFWPNKKHKLLLQAALFPFKEATQAFELWRAQQSIQQIEPVEYQFLPLIYKRISHCLKSIEDKNRLRGIYKHNWIYNQSRIQAFTTLLSELPEPLSSQYLVMKGAALVLMGHYDIGARVLGDIDILVRKKYSMELINFFLKKGFEFVDTPVFKEGALCPLWIEKKHAIVFSKDYGAFNLRIDMHFSPLKQLPSALFEDALWFDYAKVVMYQTMPIFCLNSADLLLVTCVHGMKSAPVPLYRWIMDAVTLIQSEPLLDWERFLKQAQQYNFVLPIKNSLRFLEKNFAVSIPPKEFEALKQLPISLGDRVELLLLTKSICRFLMPITFYYSRSRRVNMRLSDFLSQCWGLSSKWQLPFIISKKTWRFFITYKKRTPVILE